MKEDIFFDYSLEPGKEYNYEDVVKSKNEKPIISIITSYFNDKDHIKQTARCVLNQTFPYWEWIIVDDGSTQKETKQILEEIKKLDDRIKVYTKENEGLAKGRDYAIKKTSKYTQYIFPLDSDDLIEPTVLETSYWALQTNLSATWAYTYIVGFENMKYLDNRKFDLETMKKDNMITATALIRKKIVLENNGYSVAKRYINEDWHLWLRLMQKGCFPVQIGFYGFWYRRKKQGLLKQINYNNENNEKRINELENEAKKITKNIEAIKYPEDYKNSCGNINLDIIKNKLEFNTKKENILYIIPWIKTDKFTFELIKKLEKSENRPIIITVKPCEYIYRQKMEKYAIVFDLTTFLNYRYWDEFVDYIITTRNIEKIINCNNEFGKKIIRKYKNIKSESYNYEEDNSQYELDIKKYKKSRRIYNRILKKIKRGLKLERM